MRSHFKPRGRTVRSLHRIVAITLVALASFLVAAAVGTAPAAADEHTQVSGFVKVSQTGEGVENAELSLKDGQGNEVGTAKTDKQGRFEIKVEEPGAYTVQLNKDSLPKGIVLGDTTTDRQVTIGSSGSAVVIYSVSDGTTAEAAFDFTFLQLTVEGIRYGLIIAITAIGLSLIFGTTGLTNFAHGELVTIGAFVAWIVNTGWGLPLALATIVAVLFGIAVGALNDLAIWRPLRRRSAGLIAMLVVSIGLGMILRYLLLLLVGGSRESYDTPAQTGFQVGPITLIPRDLIAMALCVVVLVAVAVMLQTTRIGKAMRAVADNRDLAASSGINVDRVIMLVWMLGGGLAAFGGVIYGWTINLRFDMGFTLLLLMFAGVTLGGLGTAYGALLGSLVIGVLVQLSTLVIPDDIKTTAGLLVLILILLVRPSGLLGARQRIG